jgi:hypothetical protein
MTFSVLPEWKSAKVEAEYLFPSFLDEGQTQQGDWTLIT